MTPNPDTYLHHFEEIHAPIDHKIELIEWLHVLAHEAYDRALDELETVDKQALAGDFNGNSQTKMID